jgi:hypothetical protein
MTFAAITYDIKPAFDDEVAEIFSPANFKRASSPVIRNEAGKVVGHIIGTGLFLRGDAMARIIQYDGQLEDVSRHMAGQAGVHEAEREIAPYLRTPRDTETAAGFMAYFSRSTMNCLAQQIYNGRPLNGIAAVVDRIPPQSAPAARAILAGSWPEVTGTGGSQVHAALAFQFNDMLIRGLVYQGDLDDALDALDAAGATETERRLAELTGGDPGQPGSFRDTFHAKQMRCISCLSIGMLVSR